MLDGIAELAALQSRLFAIETQQATRLAAIYVAIFTLSAILLLSGCILTLTGVALFLAERTTIPIWAAFVMTGACALLTAAIIAFASVIRFRKQTRILFERSRQSVAVNLACVRELVSARTSSSSSVTGDN